MADYLPRSAWGARPPRSGPGALTVSRVQGIGVHWPGMAKPIDAAGEAGKARVASALRGWQNYHMDDKGWSDIAYQVAVDQAGRKWTLRGLRTQSAANGGDEVNETHGAILLILAPGEQPSAAMKAAVREVVADFRTIYPEGTRIAPHSAIRQIGGTDCPGDAARAAIARGDFNPTSTPPPRPQPPEEDDMANADQVLAEIQALRAEERARYDTETKRWQVEAERWKVEADRWKHLWGALPAAIDTAALAAAVVAKLPAGQVSQATVEAAVRAVLGSLDEE